MPLFETPRKEGMCLRPEQLFEKAEVRGGEEAPSQALILGAVTVTPWDQTAWSQPPWDREVIWSLIFAPGSQNNSSKRADCLEPVSSCTIRLPFKPRILSTEGTKNGTLPISAAFCQTNFFMAGNSSHVFFSFKPSQMQMLKINKLN